jgi:hypothetical protein
LVDIPGNSTTTATIGVGGTVSNSLEVAGDHDWFKISLTAGQSVSVSLDGITLEDSYLRIYDSAGNLLYENDDISSGVDRDSLLAFTATQTGTYYIDVGAWEPAPPDVPPGYTGTGTYQLSVTPYTPPPLATVQQVADQLVSGYWSGDSHHFDVTQGGTITVNITALTGAGQNLARAALAAWTDIIGVTFTEVLTGGQITFDDNEQGAFTNDAWSNGITTSAHVNISTQWLADYGTGLNTYSYQSYIHEIGHALGLGHAGNYNGAARYPYDALFQNDSWAVSIMSYFSQTDNTYFAGQGFDENFITTPMMADILAMSMLYGLSTATGAGNDTYGYASGWHTNIGALCIFDSGGIDTIDVAGLGGNQLINLNPGTFSNIMDEVGNVSIAIGVIIENATSSSGNDTLIGNDVANILTSGGGNDTLRGGGGDDWLVPGWGNNSLDGASGTDTVDYIEGMTAGGISINLGLGTATNNGGAGSDTLTSVENVRGTTYNDVIVGSNVSNVLEGHHGNDTISGGSGDDTLIGDTDGTPMIAYNDVLDGGAGSDKLTGNLGSDIMTGGSGSDSFIDTAAGLNGDTITDFAPGDKIVLSNASLASFSFSLSGNTLTYSGGSLTLTGFTGHLQASAAVGGGVQLTVVQDARNDFNGDGRSDILWRNDNGTVTDWLGRTDGRFDGNTANANIKVGADWQVAGAGDFNGDGRDDVIWRSNNGALAEWLGQANGGFHGNAGANSNVAISWHVAGVGDFNGDGRDDILWRNDNGRMAEWLGQTNGAFAANAGVANNVAASWHVAGVGDFNGDGRDDVIWRNDNGALAEWLGQADGGFAANAGVSNNVATSWHVIGVGDFNGDGRDDILWRNDNGTVTDWLGRADGRFDGNTVNANIKVGSDWQVSGVGDFNGDGRDDVLWRSDSGALAEWLGQANGGFHGNASANYDVATSWHIQAPDIF